MRTKPRTIWPRCLCGMPYYHKGNRRDMTMYEAFSHKPHRCDYTASVKRDHEELVAREIERGGAA